MSGVFTTRNLRVKTSQTRSGRSAHSIWVHDGTCNYGGKGWKSGSLLQARANDLVWGINGTFFCLGHSHTPAAATLTLLLSAPQINPFFHHPQLMRFLRNECQSDSGRNIDSGTILDHI